MTDEMKKALTEFVEKALILGNQGVDQIPGVLNDMVGAYILSTSMWLAWWGVCTILLIIAGVLNWKYAEREDDRTFGTFCCGLVGCVTFLGVLIQGYNILYAIWFPRLIILDYLKGLV